jgi:hypothetical protein
MTTDLKGSRTAGGACVMIAMKKTVIQTLARKQIPRRFQMESINLHTSFGGDIYLRNHSQIGWEVEIYEPRDIFTSSKRQMIVPSKYFKSKSGAMSFIKRTIVKYASIMGELEVS